MTYSLGTRKGVKCIGLLKGIDRGGGLRSTRHTPPSINRAPLCIWWAFCAFFMLIYFFDQASSSSYSFGGLLAKDQKKSPSFNSCAKASIKISGVAKGISNAVQVNRCMYSCRDFYGFCFKLNKLRGMDGYLLELEKRHRKSVTKNIKKLYEICFHSIEPLLV